MPEFQLASMIVCPETGKDYPRIERAEGVYLYDEKGNRYIDVSGGSAAVSNIGHGNKELAAIMAEQAAKVSITPTHCFSSPISEAYMKRLVEFCPPGFSKAWTVSSGTEAVENALKVALQFHQLNGEPQRYKMIGRWGSYHGNSIFTLDVGGMKLRRQSYGRLLLQHPHVQPAYHYRSGSVDEARFLHDCLADLENTIREEGPDTIAAFIAEPVVGAALGAVPAPAGYFEGVRTLCDRYGILFIVDEVMTGFCRTGKNFGIEHWDAVPDIIAAGKGIASGYYPLSAVVLHHKVAEVFEKKRASFLGGHTYACNPLASAIGLYVVDFMEKEQINKRVTENGKFFREQLETLYELPIVGDVRGIGLLQGFELVKDKQTKEPFDPALRLSKQIGAAALERGVVLYPGTGSVDGIAGDHVLLAPPLIIGQEVLVEVVKVIRECIEEVCRTAPEINAVLA